jgi:hypothetical protein
MRPKALDALLILGIAPENRAECGGKIFIVHRVVIGMVLDPLSPLGLVASHPSKAGLVGIAVLD